ncbi:MAG: hypothetical protein IPL65_01680 [Lewinellaceae bacterium]|nr:hypothetical protein [Lewinellaceae bacterium]
MARSKPTYLYAIISVALVLFMLGFFAISALHARQLVQLFKEKVDVWLELSPNHSQEDVLRVIAEVRQQDFVKKESVTFITRDQAAAIMRKDLGDESLLQEVPDMLRDVVRFNVDAAYLNQDSLLEWRTSMRQDSAVADIYYEAANIGNIGGNIQKLGWITLGLGFLLIFAAITIIHNTIRLALYTNRFLIKNQELVGASWRFISRPFIRRGIMNGLWSAALAIGMLIVMVWWGQKTMPDLKDLEDLNGILATFTGLIVLGVIISGLSSYFVVNKFLRMRVDDLY